MTRSKPIPFLTSAPAIPLVVTDTNGVRRARAGELDEKGQRCSASVAKSPSGGDLLGLLRLEGDMVSERFELSDEAPG